MDYAFGFMSKKSLPNPRQERFIPMASSRNVIILGFTLRL